ncbi:hypothetical protein N9O56_01840 [Rickettsiales bacterium]|nr:hypothetical protein [Rickettsiales bacterium]
MKNIDNYNDFIIHIKNHKFCSLVGFIHLFAYNKNQNWKFEDAIPESKFGLTFHPLWWRFQLASYSEDSGHNNYDNFGNFLEFSLINLISTTTYQESLPALKNVYDTCTKESFSIKKEDFIKSYKLLIDITRFLTVNFGGNDLLSQYITQGFIPHGALKVLKTDKELENLYYKTKEFWGVLNEVENFLFNLSEENLQNLGAKSIEHGSKKPSRIKSFCKKPVIYNYYKSLVTQLQIKTSEYNNQSYVEFSTEESIDYFCNINYKSKHQYLANYNELLNEIHLSKITREDALYIFIGLDPSFARKFKTISNGYNFPKEKPKFDEWEAGDVKFFEEYSSIINNFARNINVLTVFEIQEIIPEENFEYKNFFDFTEKLYEAGYMPFSDLFDYFDSIGKCLEYNKENEIYKVFNRYSQRKRWSLYDLTYLVKSIDPVSRRWLMKYNPEFNNDVLIRDVKGQFRVFHENNTIINDFEEFLKGHEIKNENGYEIKKLLKIVIDETRIKPPRLLVDLVLGNEFRKCDKVVTLKDNDNEKKGDVDVIDDKNEEKQKKLEQEVVKEQGVGSTKRRRTALNCIIIEAMRKDITNNKGLSNRVWNCLKIEYQQTNKHHCTIKSMNNDYIEWINPTNSNIKKMTRKTFINNVSKFKKEEFEHNQF